MLFKALRFSLDEYPPLRHFVSLVGQGCLDVISTHFGMQFPHSKREYRPSWQVLYIDKYQCIKLLTANGASTTNRASVIQLANQSDTGQQWSIILVLCMWDGAWNL